MIVTKLVGGLGNQMFQYAAGKSLALKHASRLKIDTQWFTTIAEVDTQRVYELDYFKLDQEFSKTGEYLMIDPQASVLSHVAQRLKHPAKPILHQFKEKRYAYNPEFDDLSDNTYLEDYWQSYKYFDEIRKVLLKDFSHRKEPTGLNKKYSELIPKQRAISLHIRRGDYVSNKAAASFHGLADLAYYKRAVKHIVKSVPDAHFYIFSDDPEWCQQNLKLEQPTTFISHNKAGAEDMRLMSLCKHNIIANSSFSWWGAWLNQNPGKLVIGPKQWFANASVNTRDLMPPEWIRL